MSSKRNCEEVTFLFSHNQHQLDHLLSLLQFYFSLHISFLKIFHLKKKKSKQTFANECEYESQSHCKYPKETNEYKSSLLSPSRQSITKQYDVSEKMMSSNF